MSTNSEGYHKIPIKDGSAYDVYASLYGVTSDSFFAEEQAASLANIFSNTRYETS